MVFDVSDSKLVESILKKYSRKEDTVAALQELQAAFGYLERTHLELLAKQLQVPLVHISSVATFYTQFRFTPKGVYHISICRGTTCHVKNSEDILKHLERKLSIKVGELTTDKKISLECVNCIGACAKAPAMMINETVYGELNEKKVDKILSSLK
ncbi:MAG: NADH-quinone oxidoreductase subunit NuoE [Bacteroidota bacterium]